MKCLSLTALFLTIPLLATAEIKTRTIDYNQGGVPLEGYLAYDDAARGKRPGVLVIHEWDGLGSYVKKRAEQLAGLGYAAFAADIYGKGVRPSGMKECAAEAGKYKSNHALFLARIDAGLSELRKQSEVDPARIAAIGYCFGGTAVLELARSGANIAGAVSFHGGLSTSDPAAPGAVQCPILVLTGADDPNAPPESVAAFKNEMRKAGAEARVISYPGAVHGFTNPARGTDNSKGVAYNEKADKESWEAMKEFFTRIFSR